MKVTDLKLKPDIEIYAKIAKLAAAYYLLGKLAQLLAISPGFAAAVYPPSGIALGVLLVFGNRLWPGILLGSFLINIGTLLNTTDVASIIESISLTAGIGFVASLQAFVGARLIRRFIGWPIEFLTGREIMAFLLLGGPFSCIINATLTVLILFSSGIVGRSTVSLNWWALWAGDTIGVMLFAPLLLVWFSGTKENYKNRRLATILPTLAMMALVIVFFLRTSKLEQTGIQLRFQTQMQRYADKIASDFKAYTDVLHSINALYVTEPKMTRDQFRLFANYKLSRHANVQALSWNPRVADHERQGYERYAQQQDGLRSFHFTEKDSAGRFITAPRRDEYVIVYYIEPHQGNEKALGYNIASEPARLEAIRLASDSGNPVATNCIKLVQEKKDRFGLLVLLPIYGKGLPQKTVEQRRKNLRGFAVGVFRIDDIMNASNKDINPNTISIALYGATAAEKKQLLWQNGRQEASANQRPTSSSECLFTSPLQIAERPFQITFSALPPYMAEARTGKPWIILLLGLLCATFFGAFLLVVTGHAISIERMGAVRTAELTRSNAILEHEIAERKKMEESLRRSEDRFRQVATQSGDWIWEVDAEGRYTYSSPVVVNILGYQPEEIIGKHFYDFFLPNEKEQLLPKCKEAFARKEKFLNFVNKNLHKDGHEVTLETTGMPVVGTAGNLVGYRGVDRDITERKKLEAALLQSEKLSAVGQLAGGMAHEINNPLGIILGFVQSIKFQVSSDPSLATALEFIEKEALRCKELVHNLLVFSRSSQQDQQEEVDIKNAVEESLSLILAQSRVKDIELIKDLRDGLPSIVANKNQIQQIIINLCNNAMDAMPEKGTLTVRTDRLQKNGSDWIVVEVSDTGAGIPEEIQSRIFEPFFTTKEVGKGTGLGLSLVFEIVQRHKGTIDVKSEVGKGTTFTVFLPIQTEGKRQ
ncbi:MAG: CHASE domain-containing protein [Elusimicrobia bacterium]|nr:CHASE domain-containing protein [Candidatus Obscuribacterium magneticum]